MKKSKSRVKFKQSAALDKNYFTRLQFLTHWLESLDTVTLNATMNWLNARVYDTRRKQGVKPKSTKEKA